MDPLSWLGFRKSGDSHPGLSAIQAAIRQLMPDDESVVIRYIVVVAVLLTRVARADGRFRQCELDHLRALFRHLDRLPSGEIDGLCQILNERAGALTEPEIDLCFRELKSLCDAKERLQVLRLLADQATANGAIGPAEHELLVETAERLGVSLSSLEEVEQVALSHTPPPSTAAAPTPPPPDSPRDS